MMLFPQAAELTAPHLAPKLALEGNIKSSIIAWEVKYIFEGFIEARDRNSIKTSPEN